MKVHFLDPYAQTATCLSDRPTKRHLWLKLTAERENVTCGRCARCLGITLPAPVVKARAAEVAQ